MQYLLTSDGRTAAGGLATQLAESLRREGTFSATLLPGMPPPAARLEAIAARGMLSEAVAAEDAALEWLLLLPVLLPPGGNTVPFIAAALFEVRCS